MADRKEKKYVCDNDLLMSEWDWSRNTISPYETTLGSAKKAYWKCSTCGYEWSTPVYSRGSSGTGCRLCGKIKAGKSKTISCGKVNNFLNNYPSIAAEWHPTKNTDVAVEAVSSHSNKTVWWKCSICGHEWKTAINHRTSSKKKCGCPECAKIARGQSKTRSSAEKNSLAQHYPDIALEWHPSKNGSLKPQDIPAMSAKKFWWVCGFCGNEWQMSPVNRCGKGTGCPKCSPAQTSFHEQIVFYYISQVFPDAINRYQCDYEFDVYIPSIKVAIEYDGAFYHNSAAAQLRENKKDRYCKEKGITLYRFRAEELPDTESAIRITCEYSHITDGIRELCALLHVSCPDMNLDRDRIEIAAKFRAARIENSLATKYPMIAAEWHDEKNRGVMPSSVAPMSGTKFWWKCSCCGYEWQDSPVHRCGRGSSCPLCQGRVVVAGRNDIVTTNPDVAEEWNYEKNGALLPTQVSKGSNRKVWWKCSAHGHEWEAYVSERTRQEKSTKCPYCSNRKVLVGFNDLATTNPDLAMEWDYSCNSLFPTTVTAGSHKMVSWKCRKCGHRWDAVIYSRSNGRGCPHCAGKAKLY